ncbi:MAG: hypothetical protein NW207_00960 [Cytophagales bacterium]|nr:hypothetical protein [Cytophagales bacterium]
MKIQNDISLEYLLNIVNMLPLRQQKLLKVALDKGTQKQSQTKSNLEVLLLSGPVATKEQIGIIKKTGKQLINGEQTNTH